jgi:hypothetical protein
MVNIIRNDLGGKVDILSTLTTMKSVYEKQIKELKQDKKDGKVCDRQYKIQLKIWQDRVKDYDKMISERESIFTK